VPPPNNQTKLNKTFLGRNLEPTDVSVNP